MVTRTSDLGSDRGHRGHRPGRFRTGDGLCEEIAPAVFTLLDDGLAYVKEGADVKNEPGGSAGMAAVPEDLEDAVVEASEECPGECIFIEQS